jgi:hypothetical protein
MAYHRAGTHPSYAFGCSPWPIDSSRTSTTSRSRLPRSRAPLLDRLPDYRSDQESRSLVVSSGLALLPMAGIAPGLQRRKVV